MKIVVPSYYSAFSCIAGACRHSCCIGWEIGIDPATAARYAAVDGVFGDRLRDAMIRDEQGGTTMRLTADERCPFLAADGLCDIICTMGDDALCQICADHPRYRAFFTDRTEMGLGACCEAAASLILSQQAPTTFVTLDDGENDTVVPTAEEQAFFTLRDRLVALAQDRTQSLSAREQALLEAVDAVRPPLSDRAFSAILSPLERLDPAWDTVLARLQSPPPVLADAPVPLEQLLVYFLWRHLPDGRFDGRLAARVAFAVHSVRLIRRLRTNDTTEELAELMRAYCAEIEYSEDNLEALFDAFDITPRF